MTTPAPPALSTTTSNQGRQELDLLYRQALPNGSIALWNMRPVEHPQPADALAITQALRTEGDLAARKLAYQLEQLCRAS